MLLNIPSVIYSSFLRRTNLSVEYTATVSTCFHTVIPYNITLGEGSVRGRLHGTMIRRALCAYPVCAQLCGEPTKMVVLSSTKTVNIAQSRSSVCMRVTRPRNWSSVLVNFTWWPTARGRGRPQVCGSVRMSHKDPSPPEPRCNAAFNSIEPRLSAEWEQLGLSGVVLERAKGFLRRSRAAVTCIVAGAWCCSLVVYMQLTVSIPCSWIKCDIDELLMCTWVIQIHAPWTRQFGLSQHFKILCCYLWFAMSVEQFSSSEWVCHVFCWKLVVCRARSPDASNNFIHTRPSIRTLADDQFIQVGMGMIAVSRWKNCRLLYYQAEQKSHRIIWGREI